MGKNHLLIFVLLVTGTLAEDATEAPPPPDVKPSVAEEMDPVAASTTPPLPLPADASSGLIMTAEENPKAEASGQEPAGPMAAPGGVSIQVETLKYKWTIVNYSHNNLRFGDALYSPQFWGPKSKNYKWQLVVYPKGYDQEQPEGVGVYLGFNGPLGVTPHVKVSILNNLGNPAITFVFSNTPYHENYAHGWPSFTTQGFLDYYKGIYLPSDRLTIEAEIVFTAGSSSISGHCASSYDPECKKMPYGKEFHNDIYAYASHGSSSAHAAALAGHSGWLRKSIDVSPRPFSINFPANVDSEDMHEVLRFIYTGKIDKRNAKRMHEVAKILEMDKLQAHAEEILCLAGQT